MPSFLHLTSFRRRLSRLHCHRILKPDGSLGKGHGDLGFVKSHLDATTKFAGHVHLLKGFGLNPKMKGDAVVADTVHAKDLGAFWSMASILEKLGRNY